MAAILESRSPDITLRLGEKIGRLLFPGGIIALIGPLGCGKTVMAKGLAKGLGVQENEYVSSPTFTIINEYRGRLPIYHFDLYRLEIEEIDSVGYKEYFFGKGVTIVEWADKIQEFLPRELLRIDLEIRTDQSRQIIVDGWGRGYKEIALTLKNRGECETH